jgi:hypothetical protein
MQAPRGLKSAQRTKNKRLIGTTEEAAEKGEKADPSATKVAS